MECPACQSAAAREAARDLPERTVQSYRRPLYHFVSQRTELSASKNVYPRGGSLSYKVPGQPGAYNNCESSKELNVGDFVSVLTGDVAGIA